MKSGAFTPKKHAYPVQSLLCYHLQNVSTAFYFCIIWLMRFDPRGCYTRHLQSQVCTEGPLISKSESSLCNACFMSLSLWQDQGLIFKIHESRGCAQKCKYTWTPIDLSGQLQTQIRYLWVQKANEARIACAIRILTRPNWIQNCTHTRAFHGLKTSSQGTCSQYNLPIT